MSREEKIKPIIINEKAFYRIRKKYMLITGLFSLITGPILLSAFGMLIYAMVMSKTLTEALELLLYGLIYPALFTIPIFLILSTPIASFYTVYKRKYVANLLNGDHFIDPLWIGKYEVNKILRVKIEKDKVRMVYIGGEESFIGQNVFELEFLERPDELLSHPEILKINQQDLKSLIPKYPNIHEFEKRIAQLDEPPFSLLDSLSKLFSFLSGVIVLVLMVSFAVLLVFFISNLFVGSFLSRILGAIILLW